MTVKQKPNKRVVLKSKEKNSEGKSRYQDLIGIWSEGERPYAAFDRRVVGIVLDTGETLQTSSFYVNLDDNDRRATEPRRAAPDVFNDFEG